MKLTFFRFINVVPIQMVLSMLLLYSCNNSNKQEHDKTPKSALNIEDRHLKQQVLSGDTIAYLRLRDSYVMNDNPTDFLIWALIMANKYHFKTAYYDIFFCIQEINTYYGKYSKEKKVYDNILDSVTNEFSKSYLNKLSDTVLVNKTLHSYFKDDKGLDFQK